MIAAILIIVAIICFTLYSRKRKRALTQNILTDAQKKLLVKHIAFYNKLTDADKLDFEDKIERFLDDVRIEAVGFNLTDTDRLMVASSAIIPIFGFKDWSYRNVTNVLLYPDTFDDKFQYEGDHRNIMGMVGSGYMNGQM